MGQRGEMIAAGVAVRQRIEQMLAGVWETISSPERVAEYDRWNGEAAGMEGQRLRKERLAKLELELEPRVHQAIIASAELKPHPDSPGTSLRAAQRWLHRRDLAPLLILAGKHGCGKSVGAAWSAANNAGSTAWYSASDIVRMHALNADDDERRDRRRARKATLLVIDDVGTEGDAVRMCAALCELLDKRQQRKTIWTTNLSKEALMRRFDDPRLHSRLEQSAVFVPDHGPDLRGR